ncbi:DNA replication factor Cdt1-like [Vespula maculifrons]|uniref:DNA replication factor Cdt1-like n=1 Tax=Vespula maculifrons TaxID=7453 RepID=A0ABD2D3H7_VESMC
MFSNVCFNVFEISLNEEQFLSRIQRAKSLFHCNTRLEKALQRLAEAKMISKSKSPDVFSTNKPTNSTKNKVNIMVRAKQTAKVLEMMTQTPDLDKEATLYSRLPELVFL